jgi:hypothetical protein
MVNENLKESTAKTIVLMSQQSPSIRIDHTGDSLRVSDLAGYIKLHAFAPGGKGNFRVTITVESIDSYAQRSYDQLRNVDYGTMRDKNDGREIE